MPARARWMASVKMEATERSEEESEGWGWGWNAKEVEVTDEMDEGD